MTALESEFSLRIELGNAAMSTPEQVAQALRKAADAVETHREDGPILDLNGNSVGRWAVNYPDPGED